VLEFAILGLLKERAMHGYDLRKRLREDFGPLSNLSFGSLYPALSRLERSGAIRAVTPRLGEAGPAEPPVLLTGSLAGERAATVARRATAKMAETLGGRGTRARKVYEITATGEEIFERMLEEPGSDLDPRGFSLRLAFARHLSPAARIRLLERRQVELADRVQRATTNLARPSRVLDTYERSLAEHAREAMMNDLTWIERLLDSERRALQAPAHPIDTAPAPGVTSNDNGPHPVTTGAGMTNDGGIDA
jgi:DNA-binding PadR family transcriptional regulator